MCQSEARKLRENCTKRTEGTDTNFDVFVSFFSSKGAAISEKVDEAYSNAPINVQDERVLLRGGDLLHSESVVEERVAREVLLHILLHKLYAKIGVVYRLDLVPNSANWEADFISINLQNN